MEFTPQNVAKLNAVSGERSTFPHRPVDLVYLTRYSKGNAVLEREVLELFRRQSRSCLEKLRNAQQDVAWREAACTLKTAARYVGAWQILNSCINLFYHCDHRVFYLVSAVTAAVISRVSVPAGREK